MQIGTALRVLHVRAHRMMIDLIRYEAVALSLRSVLGGEFLSDFHQFNSSASLLLMKRSRSGSFSSYGLHHLLCGSVVNESLCSMMIGRTALSPSISLLIDLLVSSVRSWAVKRLNGLRC